MFDISEHDHPALMTWLASIVVLYGEENVICLDRI